MRGIDHLVLPVRDLERARRTYARLGFTLTPRAEHPWGTANHLVQLQGSFLEILGIGRPELIAEAAPGGFSFGAFNRDFLARREGFSMLVLDSRDAEADRADFAARGLPTFPRFDFERAARQPDGTERKVAFSLAFTALPGVSEAGFFTCAQHFPENFWRADFQRHANGALGIAAVTLVAPEPEPLAAPLAAFAGADAARPQPDGFAIETARGTIELVTPAAFRDRFGTEPAVAGPHLAGVDIRVADLAAARAALRAGGFAPADRAGRLLVPAAETFGVAYAFSAA